MNHEKPYFADSKLVYTCRKCYADFITEEEVQTHLEDCDGEHWEKPE